MQKGATAADMMLRTHFDVSKARSDFEVEDWLLDELWENLHHQGDVGLASYLVVPQLARLAEAKGLFYWKLIGLCAVIEAQRHSGTNPELPVELKDYYTRGLTSLRDLVLRHLKNELDADSLRMSFAMWPCAMVKSNWVEL